MNKILIILFETSQIPMMSDLILTYKSKSILERNKTYLGDSQSAQDTATGEPLSENRDLQTGLRAQHQTTKDRDIALTWYCPSFSMRSLENSLCLHFPVLDKMQIIIMQPLSL